MNKSINNKIINVRAILSLLFPAFFVITIGIVFIVTTSGVLDSHYHWISADAKVISYNEMTHTMVLEYIVNGSKYQLHDVSYSGTVFINQLIAIKVNPNNLQDIYFWEFNGGLITLFTVVGSFLIAIPTIIVILKLFSGITRNKKVKSINEQLHLNYQPNFLFEYKLLNDKEAKIYHFTPREGDVHNFLVIDDDGKEYFVTECLSKFNLFSKTYQLIDYTTRQTIIVKLSKGSNKNDNTQIPVKVNKKNFIDYFMERHVNFDIRYNEKRQSNIYNIFNGSNKIGEVYDEPGYRNVYMIKTMKENIDDIALFLLCLSYNN